MKLRLTVVASLMCVIMAVLAAPALAQQLSRVQQLPACGTGDEADYGNPYLSPVQGPAGSSFTVTGTLATWPSDVDVWWDFEGTPELLTTLTMDMAGNYSGTVNVPTDAAEGVYTVALWHTDSEFSPLCLTFTVTAATAQQDAYPSGTVAQGTTPSTLPSTGLFLLVPVAGFAAAGLGAAILTRRR